MTVSRLMRCAAAGAWLIAAGCSSKTDEKQPTLSSPPNPKVKLQTDSDAGSGGGKLPSK